MGKIRIWENGVSYYVDSAVAVGSETIYTGCMRCGRMVQQGQEYCHGCGRKDHGEKSDSKAET